MVPPLHYFVGSNDYEEPRPPRRGSHRPEQAPTRPLSVWSYSDDPSDDYFYQELPTPGGFLFSKRYVPYSRERPTLPARVSLAQEHRYFAESPVTDGLISSPESTDDNAGRRRACSPLELLQQLRGRTPDRYSVEKSILESYVRAAPQSAACQSVQKRCMFPSCTKISVSRGLCRGHGGGRRCHVPGCTKSAQSRSNFCWAHGGGQRCEADECMRSRKSKRFCVAHLYLENGDNAQGEKGGAAKTRSRAGATRGTSSAAASQPSSAVPTMTMRALPSLGQALSSASRSAPNLPARGYPKSLGLVYHTF